MRNFIYPTIYCIPSIVPSMDYLLLHLIVFQNEKCFTHFDHSIIAQAALFLTASHFFESMVDIASCLHDFHGSLWKINLNMVFTFHIFFMFLIALFHAFHFRYAFFIQAQMNQCLHFTLPLFSLNGLCLSFPSTSHF